MATTTTFRRNNLGMLRCVISMFDYPISTESPNQTSNKVNSIGLPCFGMKEGGDCTSRMTRIIIPLSRIHHRTLNLRNSPKRNQCYTSVPSKNTFIHARNWSIRNGTYFLRRTATAVGRWEYHNNEVQQTVLETNDLEHDYCINSP